MLTVAQHSRLLELSRELEKVKGHPSPSVRMKVEKYSDVEIAQAMLEIAMVIAEEDGHEAWMLIDARYKHAEAGVIEVALTNRKQRDI